MKSSKKFFVLGGIFLVISLIFTYLVKTFDVAEIGETTTAVGFSSFNNAVFENIGVNFSLYGVTDLVGLIPIVFAGVYGLTGAIQLFERKSLKKVDYGILALGGLFAVAFSVYVFFGKFALNYRPVFIDGMLEASFPSSHTMLILCICFGIIFLNQIYYKDNKLTKYINILLAFLAAFIVSGRFLSGVHWATDIIGGLLFATSFLLIYLGFLIPKSSKKQSKVTRILN